MSKYIHNISGSQKTYRGFVIEDDVFFQIPTNQIIQFAGDSATLAAIASSEIKMSSDGITNIDDVGKQLSFLRDDFLFDVDSEGRQVTRQAAAKAGWTILIHNIELETSNLTGLYSKDYLGNDSNGLSVKFYDINNTELTTQGSIDTDCVKTELIFKPNYDYEILGGNVFHVEEPATDVRLWCIGGMLEGGAAYVKEMIRGVNFRYISVGDHIKIDGRTTKYMKKDTVGAPYQTNQLKFIIKHNAGLKFKISIAIEYFRA